MGTTAGAGCFMFLCQMTFFTKMASMIVLTIAMSVLYTFGWFLPLLLLIGPATPIASSRGFGNCFLSFLKGRNGSSPSSGKSGAGPGLPTSRFNLDNSGSAQGNDSQAEQLGKGYTF